MNAFAAESAAWSLRGFCTDAAAEAKSAALDVKALRIDDLRKRSANLRKFLAAAEKAAIAYEAALDDAPVALPPEVAHVG